MELGEDGSVYKSILVREPGAGQGGAWGGVDLTLLGIRLGLGSQDSIVASVELRQLFDVGGYCALVSHDLSFRSCMT